MADNLSAALDLLRRGLAVVPIWPVDAAGRCACRNDSCDAAGRHPKWTAGNYATTPETVTQHWNQHPADQVGYDRAGSAVVTVDDDGGLPEWQAATACPLPDTLTLRTPSGRLHRVYRVPPGTPALNMIKHAGYLVDILAAGRGPGPGVRRAAGVYALADDRPVADAPAQLVALLHQGAAERAARDPDVVTAEEPPDPLPEPVAELLARPDPDWPPAEGRGEGIDRSYAAYAIVAACFDAGLTQGQAVGVLEDFPPAVEKFEPRGPDALAEDVARGWGQLRAKAGPEPAWLTERRPPTPLEAYAAQHVPRWGALARRHGLETAPTGSAPAGAGTQATGANTDGAEPARSRLWESVLPAGIFAGGPPPTPPYVLDGLVRAGELAALASEGKAGKSLLTLDRVLHAVAKDGRRVLYLDAENGLADLHARVHKLGYADADLPGLAYLSFPSLALDTPADAAELLRFVTELPEPPDVVVLDTASRFLAGKENDAEPWLAMYRLALLPLKRAGVAVLRLDHFGKDPTKGQRGSSAKTGDVDVVWELTADEIRTAAPGAARLHLVCTHQRSGTHEREYVLIRTPLSAPVTRHDRVGTVPAGAVMPVGDPGDRIDAIVRALDEAGAPISGRGSGRDAAYGLLHAKFPGATEKQWAAAVRRRKARGPLHGTAPTPSTDVGAEPARLAAQEGSGDNLRAQVAQVRAGTEFPQVKPARAASAQVEKRAPLTLPWVAVGG